MSHSEENLKRHILPLSRSSTFSVARTEWDLVAVEISEEWDNCPCGQSIKEHCYIRNRLTEQETYVGNVCINRFLQMDTGSLFDGLKRIRDKESANPNDAVIEYAQERGYLFGNEYGFLKSTSKKRKLSSKQAAWKEKINRRILNGTVVSRRGISK